MKKFVVECRNDFDVTVMTVLIDMAQDIQIERFSEEWDAKLEDIAAAASAAENGDHLLYAIGAFVKESFPGIDFDLHDIASYSLDSVNI